MIYAYKYHIFKLRGKMISKYKHELNSTKRFGIKSDKEFLKNNEDGGISGYIPEALLTTKSLLIGVTVALTAAAVIALFVANNTDIAAL